MTTEAREHSEIRLDPLTALEDSGYRITEPRRRVVELLNGKADGFTAEEISDDLPNGGRATVFRTIKLLLESGVMCKLAMPDGTPVYSMARVGHHHHTVCVKCGNIGEFKHVTIERLMRAIGREVSGEIVGHRIEVFVNCGACG